MNRVLCAVAVCVLAVGLGWNRLAQAASDSSDGQWRYAVTPYVWLPNVNGTLRFDMPSGGGDSAESRIDGNPFLQNLKFALLVAGEARKDRWAIITDFIYLDFDGEQSALRSVSGPGGVISIPRDTNLDTKTSLTGWAVTMAGSYQMTRSDAATLDVLGGLRYLGVRAALDWSLTSTLTGPGFVVQRTGAVSTTADLLDGIVGARGKVSLGSAAWFVPYYLDVGAGSSRLTWQAMIGLGYAFHGWDVLLAYRHLSYEQGGNKLIRDLRFDGPALAATFRF